MPPVVSLLLLVLLLVAPTLLVARARRRRVFFAMFAHLTVLRVLVEVTPPSLPGVVLPGGGVLSGNVMAHVASLLVITALLVDTNESGTARRVAALVVGVDGAMVCYRLLVIATTPLPGSPPMVAVAASRVTLAVVTLAQVGLLVVLLERVRRRTATVRRFEVGATLVLLLLVLVSSLLETSAGLLPPRGPVTPAGLLTAWAGLALVLGVAFAPPLVVYLELSRRKVLQFHATPKPLDRVALADRGRLEQLVRQQEGVLAERTTEAARLRDEVAELSDALTDALLVVDEDGLVTGANERALRLLDGDVRGSRLASSSPRVWRALVDEDGSSMVELGGTGRTVDVRVLTSVTGRRLVLLRDVTEEAVRRAEADAAEELAATRAEELGRAKQALFRAASHELRTPVTVLSAGLDTLLDRGDLLDPSRRAEIEASLRRQAERLRLLVEDLTDVQRFGGVQRDDPAVQVDLVDLVRTTISTAECAARTSLCGPERLEVTTDPTHVVRIIDNLLSNVGKYAPDGPVEVHVERSGTSGCLLRVRDHGPGLPAEEHERVFDAFYRVDDAHPQPGTGVGLSLVRELARLLGGSAGIVAHDGPGLLVEVQVPDQARPDEPVAARAAVGG